MAFDNIQIGIQLNKDLSVHGWAYFSKNIGYGIIEGYRYYKNGITLLYFPNLFGQRTVKLRFNLGKAYANNNLASLWACNLTDLHQRLNQLLSGVIDLNEIGPIRYWQVLEYECFADFIIPEQDMDAWYSVISKCHLPYKTIDLSYYEQGTIYFHSGKSLSKSNSNIKIYDKLKQLHDTSTSLNGFATNYNNSDFVQIPLGYRVLRVELFHNKEPIRRHNKRIVIYKSINRISTPNLSSTDSPAREQCYYTLEELFKFQKQVHNLNDVIALLHLDHPVTTTKKLISAIKALGYSPTKTRNVIETLKYINNPNRYKKINYDRIRQHKKIILETGYHYITSKQELKPLSLDINVLDMLPDKLQEMIRRYHNSNIYKDYFS